MAKNLKLTFLKYREILFFVVLGFILRISGLINIRLAGDNILHWSKAADIVEKGQILLLGPSASVNSLFHLGPFYYYFLSIPYLFGNGDFRASIIFFCIINSISILLLYLFSLNFFNKRQSLQISALYTFSSYLIMVQNFPWNPNALSFFVIIILYLITKVRKGKFFYLPLISLLFGASIQLHATAIFLLPLIIFLIPIKKISIKYFIISLVSFLIIISPWIFFDLTSNFSQTKQAISIFQTSHQGCTFSYWLVHHGNGESCFWMFRNTLFAFRLFSISIFSTTNFIVVLSLLFFIPIYIWKLKSKNRNLFLVWLVSILILFLFYSSNIYLHYFLILIPLPFLMFANFLSDVEIMFKKGILISNIILLTIILINLISYFYSLQFTRG